MPVTNSGALVRAHDDGSAAGQDEACRRDKDYSQTCRSRRAWRHLGQPGMVCHRLRRGSDAGEQEQKTQSGRAERR